MRTWEWNIDQGVFLASDGCWIDYIWFERTTSGYDAYELHCDIDGVGYRIRLADAGREKITDVANALLDKLEAGWRPVNW